MTSVDAEPVAGDDRPRGPEPSPDGLNIAVPTARDVLRGWRRFRRAMNLAWRSAGKGVVEFYHSSNLTFASSIAYYALLSIFPFILLVLSILSRLTVGGNGDDQAVVNLIARALPTNFQFLSDQIIELQKAPLQLTVAGTVITLWASMGVFGAVTSAVNHAWGVEQPLGFFKHKLIAFVMMMAAGLLFVAALLLVGAVEMVQANWFSAVLRDVPWLQALTGFAYRNALLPMFVLVIGLIYYYAPNAQVRLRDVWVGAVLAAVLWRLALAGFSWYVKGFARLTVHGQVGTVVVFLVWVYVSAVILLYGVEVTATYARLRKHLPQAAPAAPVRESAVPAAEQGGASRPTI